MRGKYLNIGDRIIANSVVRRESGDCWVWIAARVRASGNYYGKITVYDHKQKRTVSKLAHRVSYEFFKETKLSPEIQLDHTCCNTLCVNPEHTEEVTNTENSNRKHARRKQ
jgi:hypothetical protein